LGKAVVAVVSVFSRFAGGPSLTDAEDNLTKLLAMDPVIVEGGIIDNTNEHEGLRCLCIANGFIFDFKPDTSSPHF
jgi:hypothetical protein